MKRVQTFYWGGYYVSWTIPTLIQRHTEGSRCKNILTGKCHECFGYELFEDGGYITELNERSNK